jgi:hypothetical protein
LTPVAVLPFFKGQVTKMGQPQKYGRDFLIQQSQDKH